MPDAPLDYGKMHVATLRRRAAAGDAKAAAYEQEFARDLARIVTSAVPDARTYQAGGAFAKHATAQARATIDTIDAINADNMRRITDVIDNINKPSASERIGKMVDPPPPRKPFEFEVPAIEMPEFDMEEIAAAHRAKEEREEEMRDHLARLADAAEEMRQHVAAAREAQRAAEVRASEAEAREVSERLRQEARTREAEKSARRWRWVTLAIGVVSMLGTVLQIVLH
jgi:hypothetical protein